MHLLYFLPISCSKTSGENYRGHFENVFSRNILSSQRNIIANGALMLWINVKQTIFMCFLQNNKKGGKNAAAKRILSEQDKNLSLVRIVIITFAK